jgi:TRAP transporter TAXI family solute receptor
MKLTLLFLALGIALFFLGLRFVDPAPPRRIVMATGTPGGAYREFGEQYRKALAKEGITVELKETSGSVENLQLLKSGAADVAFVQTGVSGEVTGGGLESLASLGFEPLWIFYRGEPLERVSGLRGKRVATGDPGSGTRVLVHRLLKDNAVIDLALESEIGGAEAATALREGRVDAACFVSAVSAPLIQSLLTDPELQLLDIDRAEAYAARHPWISKLVLPEGVVDLGRNVPRHDVEMISAVITLVAREDLHPAVAGLLVRTGTAIHGQRGIFEKAGQFPSAEFLEFPMNEDARENLSHGPSFLSRHLPFWIANAIQRLAILVLPLVTLLIPLIRMAPPIYVWRVRRQIYRWYEKLILLESRLSQTSGAAAEATRAELHRLDQEVARVKVPLSYMDELYRLRSHIAMVLRSEILPAAKP